MTPQQILHSLSGIVNTSSLCTILVEDKLKIRHLLRIIEIALFVS